MLSAKLKELREREGWSQDEVCQRLGIKRADYASYEAGRNEPRLAKLRELCKLYNVSADYLLGIDHSEQKATSNNTNKFSDEDCKLLQMLRALPLKTQGKIEGRIETEHDKFVEETERLERNNAISRKIQTSYNDLLREMTKHQTI